MFLPFNETNTKLIHESELCKVFEYKMVDTVSIDGLSTGKLCDIVRFSPNELDNELCDMFNKEVTRKDSKNIPVNMVQSYFMINKSNAVRGWHYHEFRQDHFFGLYGNPRIAVTDGNGKFECIDLFGRIVLVPSKIWHAIKDVNGFSSATAITSVVGNFCFPAYTPENPDQVSKEFDFDWELTEIK